jgi:Cofactor assembly of complex C subunit B
MNNSLSLVLPSTLLLTLLMLVGMIFFVKASVKARIQVAQFLSSESQEAIAATLKQYLGQRAFRPISLDQNQLTFEGMVRPSIFMALFLTLMVAAALFCLGLMLSLLWPLVGLKFVGLAVLAPLATLFYWKKAERPETVVLRVEQFNPQQTLITITAHRDELAELGTALNLQQRASG